MVSFKKMISSSLLAGALAVSAPWSVFADSAAGMRADYPVQSAELTSLLEQAVRSAGQTLPFTLPDSGTVTRGQAALLLAAALKLPSADEPFQDVTDHTPAADAIGAVYTHQLMNGVSEARFDPDAGLTYEQAEIVAGRVADYLKPFQLEETTIADIQKAVAQSKLTYKQLTQLYLDRIGRYDDQGIKLNAVITVNPKALDIAEQLDQERRAKGIRGPLHGIPIIVKDNFSTADMATTGGCTCLKDTVPVKDAEQISDLKAAGAIIIGKANLDEFALNTSGLSSLGGQTLNPYAPDRVPGGSSAGTGAAVAANFALAGFGTDTGGSIRIPSSYNSLVGIRPTVGLSSRSGIIPLALTQDVGGPMARTVTDAAILLDATVKYDPSDVATAYAVGHVPETYTAFLDPNGLKGARIGVATELFGSSDKEKPVTELVYGAVHDLEKLGATTVPIQIPSLKEILKYPSLSGYEFKTQLNDYLAKYEPNAKTGSLSKIIESGLFLKANEDTYKLRDTRDLTSQEYKDIVLFRTKLTRDSLLKVMADNHLDAIIYPSTVQTASKIGEAMNAGANNRLSAFSGFPAVTVPAGFTSEGLPAGIEFLGRAFDESTLIKLAYAYEQGTHNRKAPVLTQ